MLTHSDSGFCLGGNLLLSGPLAVEGGCPVGHHPVLLTYKGFSRSWVDGGSVVSSFDTIISDVSAVRMSSGACPHYSPWTTTITRHTSTPSVTWRDKIPKGLTRTTLWKGQGTPTTLLFTPVVTVSSNLCSPIFRCGVFTFDYMNKDPIFTEEWRTVIVIKQRHHIMLLFEN